MASTVQNTPSWSAKQQFDRQAAHYDEQWNSWSEETLARIIDVAKPSADDRALDVATGTGFTAMALAPLVRNVVAVDVSSGMLDVARRQAADRGITNVVFAEAPAEKLPFEDGAFDIVACRIAAHHFLSGKDFVSEVARVLAQGGRFALVDTTVPDGDPESDEWQNAVEVVRDRSHVRNLSPSEWAMLVADSGLVVESATDSGAGITIPLTDWLTKAGCAGDSAAEVRRRFANAPASAKSAFQIVEQPDGEVVFTWRRVILGATKR